MDNQVLTIKVIAPLFEAYVSTKKGIWNLRAEMTTDSKSLGLLGVIPLKMKVTRKPITKNGHDWYRFELSNGISILPGYFAKSDKLTIDYVEDVTTDLPEIPDSSDDTSSLLSDEDPTDDEIKEAERLAKEFGIRSTPDITQLVDAAVQKALAPLLESVILDIPVGDITITVRKTDLKAKTDEWYGLHKLYYAMWQAGRRANNEPTASQIANEIYGAQDDNTMTLATNLGDYKETIFSEVFSTGDDK